MNARKGVKGFVSVPPRERFWDKVDLSAGPNKCWLWLGATNTRYGMFWCGGRQVKAHRFSWEMVHGPIPDGLLVCHRCDNPPCVNPSHLFLGSMSDNILDAVAKGRHVPGGNALRTHCRNGHQFSGANVRLNKHGHRACLTCKNHYNRVRDRRAARALSGAPAETEGT